MTKVNWEDAQTLTGHVNNTVWVDQDYFFVMKFNRPLIDSLYLPMGETEKGKRIIATFDLKPGDELMMKVALSTTSVEGAKKNLQAEIPDWNFDGVKLAAHDEWNSYLSRMDVEGTDDEKTNFYTCFYHALIQPNQISDVDGMYRNAADSIVKAGTGTFYSTFSLWDTYRAAHPFYTLMVPERVDGFVNSLIEHASGCSPSCTGSKTASEETRFPCMSILRESYLYHLWAVLCTVYYDSAVHRLK